MARINLLPWREELRKERQQQFVTLTALSGHQVVPVVLLSVVPWSPWTVNWPFAK